MSNCKPNIHKEMLSDKVRMEQYKKAIEKTCIWKRVLDIGYTGILSAFAI
jgi:hypothetical protein